MQNLDPPQFCHFKFNCIFAYINWMPHTNSNPDDHDQSAFPGIFMFHKLHSDLCQSQVQRCICVTVPCTWNER